MIHSLLNLNPGELKKLTDLNHFSTPPDNFTPITQTLEEKLEERKTIHKIMSNIAIENLLESYNFQFFVQQFCKRFLFKWSDQSCTHSAAPVKGTYIPLKGPGSLAYQ